MPRFCGACGSRQGPFTVTHIGDRKTGRDIYTCPLPHIGDAERKAAAMACSNRREKRDATA